MPGLPLPHKSRMHPARPPLLTVRVGGGQDRVVDPRVTAQAVLQRVRRAEAEGRQRAARVRAALPEVVRLLREEFGARRVVLFGSLLAGRLDEDSDLDLLVDGIPAERLVPATNRAWEIVGIPVDLVPADAGRPEIVARALRDGEELVES